MPYHPMNDEEVRSFLAATPAHTGKLATTRADGRPHVAPIWFDIDDDGTIVFNTGRTTVKGRNLLRDPRVAMCVDDERPPFSFVTIEGNVVVSEDPDDLLRWATRIGGRYMGTDEAESYGRRNAVPGELVVRLRPDKVTSAKDLAD
jgi:PPOX class probable F420-dependent enzyme